MKQIITLLIAITTLLSCGKVTQEATQTKNDPVFKLSAKISLNSEPLSIQTTDDIYSVLYGINEKGKLHELAWTKSIVTIKELAPKSSEQKPAQTTQDKEPTSVNNQGANSPTISQLPAVPSSPKKAVQEPPKTPKKQIKYLSKNLDTAGLEIMSGKHTHIKGSIDSKGEVWSFSVNSIPLKYDFYLMGVFKDKQNAQFVMVDYETVSNNRSFTLPEFNDYTTFRSHLLRHYLQDDDLTRETITALTSFYDERTMVEFEPIPIPVNNVKKFIFKKPDFQYKDPFYKALISIFDFVKIDPKEATEVLKKQTHPSFNDDNRRLLTNKINQSKETSNGLSTP